VQVLGPGAAGVRSASGGEAGLGRDHELVAQPALGDECA
jgi:hypothetical protein